MASSAPEALERARQVRLMIFDVDGVLTDGRLWFGASGEQLKCFDAHDGHGIRMLALSGVPAALLSGRASPAVASRAAELGIERVLQGIDDKLAAFLHLVEKANLRVDQTG